MNDFCYISYYTGSNPELSTFWEASKFVSSVAIAFITVETQYGLVLLGCLPHYSIIALQENYPLDKKMKEKLVNWLNRLLVINVFLVLFAFFWFIVSLVGRSFNLPLGFDLWYKLWKPVFTPAIGILMLGAILSWLIRKIAQKLDSN